MYKLGKIQILEIIKIDSKGAHLSDSGDGDTVLLPERYVPKAAQTGKKIQVFVYTDSHDRPTAIRKKPIAQVGEVGLMKVKTLISGGAFVDWGMPKDLFIPRKEQVIQMRKGKSYMITPYVDQVSQRLCGSMYINKTLREDAEFEPNEFVSCVAFDSNDDGLNVVVEGKYRGFIQKIEYFKEIKISEEFKARVIKIHDGCIYLSPRKEAYVQMDDDAQKIIDKLTLNNGYMNLHDKSDPRLIKSELKMSKRAFKRAIGKLYKEKKIIIESDGIYLKRD